MPKNNDFKQADSGSDIEIIIQVVCLNINYYQVSMQEHRNLGLGYTHYIILIFTILTTCVNVACMHPLL